MGYSPWLSTYRYDDRPFVNTFLSREPIYGGSSVKIDGTASTRNFFASTPTVSSDGVRPTSWSAVTYRGGFIGPKEADCSNYKYIFHSLTARAMPFPPSDDVRSGYKGKCRIAYSDMLRDRVQTQALAKLAKAKVNLAVTVGEAPMTARYLKQAAGDLFRLLLAIKKGRWRYLRRTLRKSITRRNMPKTVGKRWLEYNYAVKPLLNDIYGSFDIWNNGILDSINLVKASSHYRERISERSNVGAYSHKASGTRQYTCRLTTFISEHSLVALKCLGLTDPKEVIWELVPFSFVVDWALPIGTWLRANQANLGLQFGMGHFSFRASVKGFSQCLYSERKVDSTIGYKEPYGASGTSTLEAYTREPLRSLPGANMYVKNPISGHHLVTVIALFTQLRSR